MYPKRIKTKSPKDSIIIYESGPRSLKYQDEESFQDYIEENESKSKVEVSPQLVDPLKIKPLSPDNGYPDELNWDDKVLADADAEILSLIKPTAKEISDVARGISNEKVRKQLMGLVWLDPELNFNGLTRRG